MRYVLDASLAVKWFVPEPMSVEARSLLGHLRTGDLELVAPESIVAEYGHALRKLVLGGKLTKDETPGLVADFLALELPLVGLRPLAEEAMRLTVAHMATFYDALYIALAEREDLKVLTADDGMANAFASLDRTVRLADFAKA